MIIHGDARSLPLRDSTVDLVVTSPPYFGIRDYGAHRTLGEEPTPSAFVKALISCTQEMARVLRPGGSLFINLGDTYAAYNANRGDGKLQRNQPQSRPSLPRGLHGGGEARNKSLMLVPERYRIACADDLGLIVRAVIVWRKTAPMPAGRIRDRVRTVHEDWVHLTKRDRYYHDEAALRTLGEGQMPPSVWPGPSAPRGTGHPAAFHPVWPERFIRGWSPPGGVVLDPFAGSGTTVAVAHACGRLGVGIELSPLYLKGGADVRP